MAENLTGLELVPRGVEGTGRATILGNEPVVQNLARLSNRMDNLYRLNLLAKAKEKAVKPEKVDYDKTPINIPAAEGGLFNAWAQDIILPSHATLLSNWQKLNPEERQVELSKVGMKANLANNFIKKVEADLPKENERLLAQGYIATPENMEKQKNNYITEMEKVARSEAAKKNVTDEGQILNLRNELIAKGNFPQYYATKVKEDASNINLNAFGSRLDKEFGTTNRYVKGPQGDWIEVSSQNIWGVNPANGAKVLNEDLAKLAIDANEEDSKMFNNSVKQFAQGAANNTGDVNAVKVTEKLIENNFNQKALLPEELKLYKDKVLPIAEQAVLQRMFAGKGDFEFKTSEQTTKQEAQQRKTGDEQGGGYVTETGYTLNPTYVPVKQGGTGAEDVIGVDGKPIFAEASPVEFANTATMVLPKDQRFKFATGSKFWLTGHLPSKASAIFGLKRTDGSYILEQPFETNSATLVRDEVYATNKETPVKIGKSNGYRPKGIIVNANEVGAVPIGRNLVVVDFEDYMDKMMTKAEKESLLKETGAIKGLKVIISTKNNPAVRAMFEQEEGSVKFDKQNAVSTYFKKNK